MGYEIVITKEASKYLARQTSSTRARILQAIRGLATNLPKSDIRPMEGDPGALRLKVGPFRVLFRLDKPEKVIYIEAIGPRGDIYKG